MADLTISTSIRAKILAALGKRAEHMIVLLPSGLEADAALFWARSQFHPGELPAVNLLPMPENGERDGYGSDTISMQVQVSVACLLGSNIPVDLGEDILAVMRREIPADPTFGGLAEDTVYQSGGVEDYPQDSDQALVVTTTWEILYRTQINNPDAQ